ncbi:phosphoribosylpyrophosphate synthetase [Flavobacterium sp. RHBU_3]|uniref:phosphoribosylpyrophosphate synthetase n=1 Tax=Flavobacterium sp. RHBU_3 TaxID=3391184 RepID=UPI0039853B02
MENYTPAFDTVTEALQWLNKEGYTVDFNLEQDCISFNNKNKSVAPGDFTIEYSFRFEGDTDPGDEDIVYGIKSETFGIKGVMISAYGTYAESLSTEMLSKLITHI